MVAEKAPIHIPMAGSKESAPSEYQHIEDALYSLDKLMPIIPEGGTDVIGVILPLPNNSSEKLVLVYDGNFFGVIPIHPLNPQDGTWKFVTTGNPRRPESEEIQTLIAELKKPREGQEQLPEKLILDIYEVTNKMAQEDIDALIIQKNDIDEKLNEVYKLKLSIVQAINQAISEALRRKNQP